MSKVVCEAVNLKCEEANCPHKEPHDFRSNEFPCRRGYCSTVARSIECVSESMDETDDDQLTILVNAVRHLGQELVETSCTEASLATASDEINSMQKDLDSYFVKTGWDEAMEVMWEEAGLQSEEDAEYG